MIAPSPSFVARSHERELEKSSSDLKVVIKKGCNHLRKLLDARELELNRLVGTAPQVVAAGRQRRRVSLCCDELDTKVPKQQCGSVSLNPGLKCGVVAACAVREDAPGRPQRRHSNAS